VLEIEVGQPRLGERGHRRRELRERGEEGPEPHPPSSQPGQLSQLRLGQGQPVEDRLGMSRQ
jgi:hypothetical protein